MRSLLSLYSRFLEFLSFVISQHVIQEEFPRATASYGVFDSAPQTHRLIVIVISPPRWTYTNWRAFFDKVFRR